MADVTLTDVSKALGFEDSKDRSTESYYGTIVLKDPNDSTSYIIERNGAYYYYVLIDGDSNPVECARLVNAKKGDRVLVNVMQNGHAVVNSRIDGDLNANDAKKIASNTLIYDHTYTYVRNQETNKIDVVFTAKVYRGGVDISNELASNHFSWWKKTEETISSSTIDNNGLEYIGSGRVITIPDVSEEIGYGLHIIGRYDDSGDTNLEDINSRVFTDINNNQLRSVVRSSTGSIRVRDLEVITSLSLSDKFLVVTSEGENLIAKSDLVDLVDKHYVHTQTTASNTWNVSHNLNKYPSVTIVDSSNNIIEADITYTNINSLVVTFNSSISGKVYCN